MRSLCNRTQNFIDLSTERANYLQHENWEEEKKNIFTTWQLYNRDDVKWCTLFSPQQSITTANFSITFEFQLKTTRFPGRTFFIRHSRLFFFTSQSQWKFHHMQRCCVVLTAVLATGAIREAAEMNILTFCCFLLLPGAQRKLQLKRKRINDAFQQITNHLMGISICRRHCNRKQRIGYRKKRLTVKTVCVT